MSNEHEGHELRRSDRHDAYYCVECDEWTESGCLDVNCDYCATRPPTPSEAGEDMES